MSYAWFHISGTNIRFAPPEYALVTGLCFGSFSFTSLGSLQMPQDGVYKRLFNGHPITVKELWKRFNLQDARGSAEDFLKMAHILALYLMGFGYNQSKTVEQWVWILVEDLDSWNRFPWGAYTYQVLMHYASILPKMRACLGPQYTFGEPVWALQLIFCSVTLDPTDEEKLQPYWLSVQTSQPLGVGSTPLQVERRLQCHHLRIRVQFVSLLQLKSSIRLRSGALMVALQQHHHQHVRSTLEHLYIRVATNTSLKYLTRPSLWIEFEARWSIN